jgi:hypothetical protein
MMVARLSALRTGHLYPKKYSWYPFLLEAESIPRPYCGRKDYSDDTIGNRFAVSVLSKLELETFRSMHTEQRFSWSKSQNFIISSCDSPDFLLFPLPHCYPLSGCTKSTSRLQVPGADGNGGVWCTVRLACTVSCSRGGAH